MRRAAVWGAVAIGAVVVLALTARSLQAQQDPASATPTVESLQARLAALTPEVTYLRDRKDIFDAMKRYTRGADRHDKDLVRSAFWPEATISFGKPMARDAYVDWEEGQLSRYAAHQHHITGQTIDIDGNTAHVESYVVYFLVPRDGRGDEKGAATPGRALVSAKSTVGSGRYLERWEKRDGQWKILVREFVEDLELQGETVDSCGTRGCLGTWDRSDPSYIRPLQPITQDERRSRSEASKKTRSPAGGQK